MKQTSRDSSNSLLSTVDFTVSHLPEVVRIEPASTCNLRCIHCPTGIGRSRNRGVMTEETFGVVLKNLEKLKPRVVVMYHGGEPFLNKHIFEWIGAIKSMGVGFVKTVTNGMLITDDMLIRIVESGLDSVEFSIDGQSPEENNAIRIGSDYHRVANTIKKLIRIKGERDNDKPTIFIANTQFADSGKAIQADPPPPRFMLDDFTGIYEESLAFKTTWALCWPGLESIKDSNFTKINQDVVSLEDVTYCPHPVETITIRWNGDVVACCYDLTSKYVLGNIKESNLANIWNNEKYKRLRRSIHDKQYLPLCYNCHVIRPHHFISLNSPAASCQELNQKGLKE